MSQVAEYVGRVVGGRYRLVSLAGTGSSASVYQAEDSRLGRVVAIKMLHGALSGDPTFLKRFRAEAKAAAALNHPHIVRVFDWGEDEAGPYLVMEYLGGGSLAAMIAAGVRLSPAQAAAVGLDAARALDYAHRRGLVHRDIKPANILFDEEGRVAIADFGLARAFAEAAWTEPAGALFGTARFTSPEQAQGRPAEGRSDVYSLALSLYEAIVGDTPFRGDSTMSLVMARVGARIEAPEATGVMGVVIEGAMEPESRNRIDAGRLIEELELAARNLPAPDQLPLVGTSGGLGGGAVDATVIGAAGTAGATVMGEFGTGDLEGPADALTGPVPRTRAPRRVRVPRQPRPRRFRVMLTLAAVLVVVGGAIATAVETQMFVPKRTVPALTGDALGAAQKIVVAHHLRLRVASRRYDKRVPAGEIASQSPRDGAMLAQGDAVEVVVSQGPPFVTVPGNLDGEPEATAAATLGAAGLHVADASLYSQTVPAGDVVSWSPASGLRWGDTVTLEVSAGPKPVTIPGDLAGEDPAAATSELQGLGLTVTSEQQNSSTVPSGKVIGTDPAAGQTTHQGDTVTLYVSKGPVIVTVPDVAGDTVEAATAALAAAGLTPQNVYGPPGGNARVFTTDPPAGSKEPEGTPVSLYTAPS